MKICNLSLILLSALFFITACQKESSFESGTSPSAGFLQDDANGECLPKTVNGVYEDGTALVPDNNYIDVHINVTKTGSFTVYTDTVNGVFFRATGNFTATGDNTVRLKGSGTPNLDGIFNYVVKYTSTECTVPITVLPAGGAVDAVFTLAGSPDECMNYVLAGDYVVGTPMTPSNSVTINVAVTSAGTYTITTPASNGMTFTGSGTLVAGAQTIVLTASGQPNAAGNSNFPLTAGTSSCNFTVVVTDGTVAPTDYFPTTAGSNWSYQYDGDPDDSIFMRAKPGTITLGGNAYTVFEATYDAAQGFGDYGAYRKSGGDYHTYIDIGDFIQLDNNASAPLDYIFLKDNVPANDTWQSSNVNVTIGGSALALRIALTLEQKDATITVGTTAYPNTIVVSERFQVMVGPTPVEITDQVGYVTSYYAKGVGLIKQDYHDPDGTTNPPVTLQMDIRRHQVVP